MGTRLRSVVLLSSSTALLLAAGTVGAGSNQRLVEKYTVIPVVLDDTLTSKTAKVGQKFETHNTAPEGGFPKNTTFAGVITKVRRAKGGTPGMLAGKYTAAVLPDGNKLPITAVASTKDGIKVASKTGKTAKKNTGENVGMGGAAVGALLGGGLKGAILGGALGFGAGKAIQGKTTDAEVKAGTRVYVMLMKAVRLPAGP